MVVYNPLVHRILWLPLKPTRSDHFEASNPRKIHDQSIADHTLYIAFFHDQNIADPIEFSMIKVSQTLWYFF